MAKKPETDQQTPDFLVGVPRKVIRHLDVDALLRDGLVAAGEARVAPAVVAHSRIKSVLNGAKLQRRRIAAATRRLHRAVEQGSIPKLDSLFSDVHFYLICWSNIGSLSRFLRDITRWTRVARAVRRYHRDIDAMTEARNHIEHLQERLVDGPKRRSMRQPGDLFNLVGDMVSFGGKKFDVGPDSMATLKALVADLDTAIAFESLEILRQVDPQLMLDRIRQAYLAEDLPRVIRRATAQRRPRPVA